MAIKRMNELTESTENGLTPQEARLMRDVLSAPCVFRPNTRGYDLVHATPNERVKLFAHWRTIDIAAGMRPMA